MFSLTSTHLRFVCEATTALRLETSTFRAGQNLRGALGQVMTRAYCAHTPTPGPSPVAKPATGEGCPICWLLAANEHPGQERRGYALVPPFDGQSPDVVSPGNRFEFGLTLFGSALQFLPYFVLAVPEMGRLGVGVGRGKFALKSVWAENPFSRARECLLAEGDNLVHTPTLTMTHADVMNAASQSDLRGLRPSPLRFGGASQDLEGLTIQFLTPTRLIEEGKLAQAPAFDALFARLLKRLDELAEQFGNGARRGMDAAQSLQRVAERVRLVEQETRWVEVFSGSSRRGAASPLSGLVGRAVYAAPPEVWSPLLPWLLWGQLAQVGKSTVKGNGVIKVTRRLGCQSFKI
ncbi:MAG: CRISPR system precrRNA processing endoribonuclease RAMP protein Cas6 [Chloroflexi bacterium]|nr:CRISPR system precrRNA processing endoribonuclease RAMP protein Cas6 [Chloroflexota bacterium]